MKTLFAITLAVLAAALCIGYVSESEALPSLWNGVACARDYMVRLVKDKVISKSTLVREYTDAMKLVKQRYEEAEKRGELANKDDQEKENFYYKLTVEELRNLKARIEAGSVKEQTSAADEKEALSGCYDPDAMVENWNPDEAGLDEEDEKELLAELDELERQARSEDEMGWSLSPEARDALKTRTHDVLVSLMNNEVRQIAMAVLTAYLSGGSIVPVLLSFTGDLKFKLADYFMNAIMDLVSAAMGRRIEINPSPSLAGLATPAPAPAAVAA